MAQQISKACERFQHIKAQEKAAAIARKSVAEQVRKANPNASDKVVEQIVQAHLKAQARTRYINGHKVEVTKA